MKKNELNELIFNYFVTNILIVLMLTFYGYFIISNVMTLELERWIQMFSCFAVAGIIIYSIGCVKESVEFWKKYNKEIKEYISDNK